MSRLEFATKHVIWTEEQCDWVHFCDESEFALFGCDGSKFVRSFSKIRYSPQWTKSSVKFEGGSVMVFDMISAAGKRTPVRWSCKINAAVYKEILKKHVLYNLRPAIHQPAVFMQGNALCQRGKSVNTILSEEDVTVIELPVQCPNMNPSKYVLKLLNERAKQKSKKHRRTMD